MKILLLSNNPREHAAGALLESLASKLRERHVVTVSFPKTTKATGVFRIIQPIASLANIVNLIKSDAIILHTLLSMNMLVVFLARIMGKKIFVIAWDIYPHSLREEGRKFPNWLFSTISYIEIWLFTLADKVLVPTQDYFSAPMLRNLNNLEVLPLWSVSGQTEPPHLLRKDRLTPLRIIFGGQINAIRDLEGALKLIDTNSARWDERVEVHIFSKDAGNFSRQELSDRVKVINHGFLPSEEYKKAMREADAGLVSLSCDFPLPAFPSKIPAYVLSGLPVIYIGPNLPHLINLIERTNIGIALSTKKYLALSSEIRRLQNEFPRSQKKYIAETRLSWRRLEKILSMRGGFPN